MFHLLFKNYELYLLALPMGFALGTGLNAFYTLSWLKQHLQAPEQRRYPNRGLLIIGAVFTSIGSLFLIGSFFYIENVRRSLLDEWALGFLIANILSTFCFTIFFIFLLSPTRRRLQKRYNNASRHPIRMSRSVPKEAKEE